MTLKQRLLFSLLMCTGMATSMSWLGMAKNLGLTSTMWRLFLVSVLPTIAFAFVLNFVVVGNLANLLIKLRTQRMADEAAIRLKANAIRGWTMLLTMCFTMSTRALLMNGTLFHMTVSQFVLSFFGTLTMAYFIREIFVMPVVRNLVFRIMPLKRPAVK